MSSCSSAPSRTAVGRDGRQALPRRRSTATSTATRPTPRAVEDATAATRARSAKSHVRPRGRRRAVGQGRVGVAGAAWTGLPVPYPVQIDGTELLMEWITVDGEPRHGSRRPGPEPTCWRRTSSSCGRHWPLWRSTGIVHGDLSAYNILAAGDRLVIIDLPQMVDLVGNPKGMDFLLRDCANI